MVAIARRVISTTVCGSGSTQTHNSRRWSDHCVRSVMAEIKGPRNRFGIPSARRLRSRTVCQTRRTGRTQASNALQTEPPDTSREPPRGCGRNLGISTPDIYAKTGHADSETERAASLLLSVLCIQRCSKEKQIEAESHFQKLDAQPCPRCTFRFGPSQLTPATKSNKNI